MHRFPLILIFALPAFLPAQVPCAGPSAGLPSIGQNTSPPAASGTFDHTYTDTFTVKRSGVYSISGRVSIGRGAGAPVDFSWLTAKVHDRTVIDEKPPPIQGSPTPPNNWSYVWSIYFWSLNKPFSVRMYLDATKTYTLTLRGTGAYTVVTPYHRRNYGMSLTATATYCGPLATSAPQGAGCAAGTAAAPTLTAPLPPVLGTRRDVLVSGKATTRGLVAVGLPAASPLYLGAGCSVHVDLALPLIPLPVTTDAAGRAFALFDIPPVPALASVRVAAQAALDNPASPVALDLTNGLILTLGY